VPDGFVAENEDGKTAGTPAESTEQDSVEQADMVADEKVSLRSIEAVESMGAPHVRDPKGEISTDTQKGLDRDQFARDTRLPGSSGFERSKTFRAGNEWGNERWSGIGRQLRLDWGAHVSQQVKQRAAGGAISNNVTRIKWVKKVKLKA